MNQNIVKMKQPQRDALKNQVDAFLNKGNTIKQVPAGTRTHSNPVVLEQYGVGTRPE